MFATRRKGNLFTTGPDRWLVLAGAGLLVLGLVLRLLTDIGRSTATGDTATPMADTQQPAPESAHSTAPPPTTAETLAATPPVPAPAPRSAANLEVDRKLVPVIEQPAPIPRAGDWGVQLGAFSKRANAERLEAQVRQLGYQASVAPSGSLSRVRVTGLANRATAQLAADSIAGALGTKGVVVGPAR